MKESHNTTNCLRAIEAVLASFSGHSHQTSCYFKQLCQTRPILFIQTAILWSEIIDKLCKTLIKHSLKVNFLATQYLIECHSVFARSCLRRDFSLCSGGVVFIFQIDSVSTRCTVRDSSQIYFDSIIKSMEAFGKPLVENT